MPALFVIKFSLVQYSVVFAGQNASVRSVVLFSRHQASYKNYGFCLLSRKFTWIDWWIPRHFLNLPQKLPGSHVREVNL